MERIIVCKTLMSRHGVIAAWRYLECLSALGLSPAMGIDFPVPPVGLGMEQSYHRVFID